MICITGYEFDDVIPIDKGVSGDKKYRVKTSDGRILLLRVSDISEYERKKTMHNIMDHVAALGVPMSRPIDFGTCNNGESVYQLLSWCDGDSADTLLPKLPETEQYKLGIKAGKILQTIHTIPPPDGLDEWHDRYMKNDGRVKSFHNRGIEIDGSDKLFSFYTQNNYLLRNRPQCFTHGDYHCGNLMISNSMKVSVIDWDLFDDNIYGDPWYEFTRILNSDVVPHFTTGLLRGYFGGEPPEDFWRLLMFYFSAGALQLVSWAAFIQPDCLEECKQTALNVLLWYDGMSNTVPTWYLSDK